MADSREARPVVGAGHSSAAPLQGTFWEALREVDSLRAPPTRLCADWARSHGLEADADAAVLDHVAPALPRIVYDALRTPVPALNDFDVDDLLSFRVPEVNEDGTCNAFNKLQVLPFRIHVAVYGYPKSRPVAMTDALVRRLWRLRRVASVLAERVGAEWLGIYRRVQNTAGYEDALVKEAYVGEASRAVFPLTADFAAKSNNSWVALRDRGRVIQDTWALDDEGGEEGVPYYECSKRVRSECCVPIRATDGTVIGIIDAEAWRPNHFTPVRVAEVMQVCDDLGQAGLLLGMLGAE